MIDFMVLPIMGCDLVLRMQWLKELGPIVWDFKTLTMQFTFEDQLVTLQGLLVGSIQLINKRQATKFGNSLRGPCTLLMTSSPATIDLTKDNKGSTVPWELQQLLAQVAEVFKVPTRLPPTRKQDHKIHLVDKIKVVKLRPYRYPFYTKE